MITMQELVAFWIKAFHEPTPVTTISVFRIVFGCLLIVNSFLLMVGRRTIYGPHAILILEKHRDSFGRFTVFRFLPVTDRAVCAILTLHSIACVSLTVGLMTRTSALIVFATMVSLYHRNPCVFHSGDAVLRLMTFLLVFSHAGKAFSFDSVLANQTTDIPIGAPWCQRLMQIQVAIVYLRTVYWKLQGSSWRTGSAVYYATQLVSYQRFVLPRRLQTVHWVKPATWITLLVESTLGSLVWIQELRYPILITGVLLHLGFELWLNVQLFGWTMIVCLLLFVEPAVVTRMLTSCGIG